MVSDPGLVPVHLGMHTISTLEQDGTNNAFIRSIDQTMKDLMAKGVYRPDN